MLDTYNEKGFKIHYCYVIPEKSGILAQRTVKHPEMSFWDDPPEKGTVRCSANRQTQAWMGYLPQISKPTALSVTVWMLPHGLYNAWLFRRPDSRDPVRPGLLDLVKMAEQPASLGTLSGGSSSVFTSPGHGIATKLLI
jgi:hypothetical protein